jgi:hypothetical protein
MYDWTDVEAARLRRRALLQEAQWARIAAGDGTHRRRVFSPSIIGWELARILGPVEKAIRLSSSRG